MRRAMITGASSDIGLALCHLYLGKGYRIIAHYNRGRAAFSELVKSSDAVTPIQIDLSDPDNLEQVIAERPETFTESDVLINAAAIFDPMPFNELTGEAVLRSMSVNLLPGLVLMRTMAPAMAQRGWGRIVNLSSIGVKFGGGSVSFGYALSKHAMEFLPSDYKIWAARNVLVNTIRVGVTDTRFHQNIPGKDMEKRVALIPAGRMASSEGMASDIFWFGSEKNTYMTGQTITIAGGE